MHWVRYARRSQDVQVAWLRLMCVHQVHALQLPACFIEQEVKRAKQAVPCSPSFKQGPCLAAPICWELVEAEPLRRGQRAAHAPLQEQQARLL